MRAEHWRERARQVAARALEQGALVPLETRTLQVPAVQPFVLRELISRPPKHLRPDGPKPNPFLPHDRPLEVAELGASHVLLLNKYPVQSCHLLVITRGWQPQSGWLAAADWAAVAAVAADTGGLWFFNSAATAGASQPHRHLQLLPRNTGEPSCPLSPQIQRLLEGGPAWPWAYRLSARRDPLGASDLPQLYADHCRSLGLGVAGHDPAPSQAYNLLFDDQWFLTVLRRREQQAGFSVNALGFAGYLLCTAGSNLDWLARHGPWRLLADVALPMAEPSAGAEPIP